MVIQKYYKLGNLVKALAVAKVRTKENYHPSTKRAEIDLANSRLSLRFTRGKRAKALLLSQRMACSFIKLG